MQSDISVVIGSIDGYPLKKNERKETDDRVTVTLLQQLVDIFLQEKT